MNKEYKKTGMNHNFKTKKAEDLEIQDLIFVVKSKTFILVDKIIKQDNKVFVYFDYYINKEWRGACWSFTKDRLLLVLESNEYR